MTATRTWTAVCALVLLALVPDATAQTRACRAKSRQAPHRVGDSRSVFAPAGAGGDNSLRTAVHTRRIIDPILGAKLTGSVGRVTFGTLSASDEGSGPRASRGRSES